MPSDPFRKIIDDKLPTESEAEQFYGERLDGWETDQWPFRIEDAAIDVLYGVQIGEAKLLGQGLPVGTIDRTNFGTATGEHYVEGIEELASPEDTTDLPVFIEEFIDEYHERTFGDMVLRFSELSADLTRHVPDVTVDDINRSLSALIEKIAVGTMSQDISSIDRSDEEIDRAAILSMPLTAAESSTEMVLQLFSDPAGVEYARAIANALENSNQRSILSELDAPQMVTQLWDHQFEALINWLNADCKGYVDMATATGKTVLGLAAIAVLFGGLHPDDGRKLRSEGISLPGHKTDSASVLVVAGQELLLKQWQREFDEHLNIPPHRTTDEDGEIVLDWGVVEFTTAQDLRQRELIKDYDLAILDEAHSYRRGGWGSVLSRLTDSADRILAMSGSIDMDTAGDSDIRTALEGHLDECMKYSLKDAREAGVIADFTWDIYYSGSASSEVLGALENLTDLIQSYFNEDALEFDLSNTLPHDWNEDVPTTFPSLGALQGFGQSEVGRKLVKKVPELDELFVAVRSRRTRSWQLTPPPDLIVSLLADHLPEQQCVVLADGYKQATTFADAIAEHYDVDIICIERDPSAQFEQVSSFREESSGVLVGPSKAIGVGVDLPNAEVAINLSRGGVNVSMIQRLGRVLRNPMGEKNAHFYQVVTVPTNEQVLLAAEDGVRLLKQATAYYSLGARFNQPPSFVASDVKTERILSLLEREGAAMLRRHNELLDDDLELPQGIEFLENLLAAIEGDGDYDPPLLCNLPLEGTTKSTPEVARSDSISSNVDVEEEPRRIYVPDGQRTINRVEEILLQARNQPSEIEDADWSFLLSVVDHDTPTVQRHAIKAIALIARTQVPQSLCKTSVIERIIGLLDSHDNGTRYGAMRTLTRIAEADETHLQPYESRVADALTDSDARIRATACDLIVTLNLTDEIPSLNRIKENDPASSVQDAADAALRRFTAQPGSHGIDSEPKGQEFVQSDDRKALDPLDEKEDAPTAARSVANSEVPAKLFNPNVSDILVVTNTDLELHHCSKNPLTKSHRSVEVDILSQDELPFQDLSLGLRGIHRHENMTLIQLSRQFPAKRSWNRPLLIQIREDEVLISEKRDSPLTDERFSIELQRHSLSDEPIEDISVLLDSFTIDEGVIVLEVRDDE